MRPLHRVVLAFAGALTAFAPSESSGQPVAPSKAPYGAGAAAGPVAFLDQGWSDADRKRFYYTSQGSRLLPYRWFLALEQADGRAPFASAANFERLRFVSEGAADPKWNPDGLPIGFVKDSGAASPPPDPEAVRATVDPNYDPAAYPKSNEWLGFTCAACHTGRLDAGGKSFRVDGGPALSDIQTFLRELRESLDRAAADAGARERFTARVLPAGADDAAKAGLAREVTTFAKVLGGYVDRNAVPAAQHYGNGRLDAFGAIFNQVASFALGMKQNRFPADAPVSYPQLWGTPEFDWVQTNASSSLPYARNLGQVLGVFAQFRLSGPPADLYRTSARLNELFLLEQWLTTLKAPAWPEALGPEFALDPKKVAAGAALYRANCVACHSVRGPDGKFPQNPALAAVPGTPVTKTGVVALAEIGTDPKFIQNFDIPVTAGAFAGALGLPGPTSRAFVVKAGAARILARQVAESGFPFRPGSPEFTRKFVELNNGHASADPLPLNGQGYKCRPLDGAWATAPFLHNGSVPNLDQLLRPAAARVMAFRVGSRRFDPKHVGFATEGGDAPFEFRVRDKAGKPIPGNSNAGHSGPKYTQTAGPDGAFRDFDDAQRAALIEYMKTLR